MIPPHLCLLWIPTTPTRELGALTIGWRQDCCSAGKENGMLHEPSRGSYSTRLRAHGLATRDVPHTTASRRLDARRCQVLSTNIRSTLTNIPRELLALLPFVLVRPLSRRLPVLHTDGRHVSMARSRLWARTTHLVVPTLVAIPTLRKMSRLRYPCPPTTLTTTTRR